MILFDQPSWSITTHLLIQIFKIIAKVVNLNYNTFVLVFGGKSYVS
jgi:hypothetical protein